MTEFLADLADLAALGDPVSSLSHGAGAVAALVGAVLLLRPRAIDRPTKIALAVFAASAVVLLALSGLYHGQAHGTPEREWLRRLDHSAIYVLIAGGLTMPATVFYRGWARVGILAAVWALVAGGIVLKLGFFHSISSGVDLLGYLGMGWLGVLMAFQVARRHGAAGVTPVLRWGLVAGLAYSAGPTLDYFGWPALAPGVFGSHELSHVLILIATACLFVCVDHQARYAPQVAAIPHAAPTALGAAPAVS